MRVVLRDSGWRNILRRVPAGVVLYYPGLEGGGATVRDYSGLSTPNNGTITGATPVRLPSGLWCLDFDGDDYISTDYIVNTAKAQAWTLFGWAYVTRKDVDQNILGSGFIANNLNFGIGGTGVYFSSWGDVAKYDVSASAISINTWFHWAFRAYNGTAEYLVDAVVRDSLTYTTGGSSRSVFIGARRHQNDPYNATQMWYGKIALEAFVNAYLTDAQISDRRNQTRRLFGV